ncbi:MAG: gamma-glutamyl-gamma-aminobutyrate hydrolase family protein, partial [Pseudomonadota bacterium]
MGRPVIGIIGNHYLLNDEYPATAAGDMNVAAVAQVCDALPLVVPADPSMVDLDDLLDTCDGFVFTGGRPNVHPRNYGEALTDAHGDMDE